MYGQEHILQQQHKRQQRVSGVCVSAGPLRSRCQGQISHARDALGQGLQGTREGAGNSQQELPGQTVNSTCFSSTHGTFAGTDYMSGPKTHQIVEIIHKFSGYSVIKLKINNKRSSACLEVKQCALLNNSFSKTYWK